MWLFGEGDRGQEQAQIFRGFKNKIGYRRITKVMLKYVKGLEAGLGRGLSATLSDVPPYSPLYDVI